MGSGCELWAMAANYRLWLGTLGSNNCPVQGQQEQTGKHTRARDVHALPEASTNDKVVWVRVATRFIIYPGCVAEKCAVT